MTDAVQNSQGSSLSLVKLKSRLSLTLQHLDVVHAALSEARKKNNVSIINHAITRHCEATLQNLYSHLNEYLKSILSEMFHKRPLQILDNAKESLRFQDIVKLGSYEAICDCMVDQIFRKLENTSSRSTASLIEKVLATTGVVVDKNLLDNATWYIELRHLIVHNSTQMDKKFVDHNLNKINHAKEGNKIQINLGTARSGIKAIQKLCQTIDNGLRHR